MKYWKCFTCESVSHHKGLCRDCTEYDDNGVIITPVRRERVDSQGNKWVKQTTRVSRDNINLQMIKQDMVNKRRKKLTKKQKALLEEQVKQMVEDKKVAESEIGESGLFEIGEAVEEE